MEALIENLKKKGDESKQMLTKKRREYKELIRMKKELEKEKALRRIEVDKTEKSFWELIKSETKKRTEVGEKIEEALWKEHFKRQYEGEEIEETTGEMGNEDRARECFIGTEITRFEI